MIYNAIKFTEPGGLIRISGEFMQDAESEEKGSLLISISDTGIGIEPEAVPRIFERFYQGSVSRGDKSEGTGLGLAIAKEIVNYYGGTIQVESEMHKGSTFRFSLPVELLSLEVE
jgi:signal transduction histidine kinase